MVYKAVPGRGRLLLLASCILVSTGFCQGAQAQDIAPPTIDRDRIDRKEPDLRPPERPVDTPSAPVSVAPAAEPANAVALSRVRFEGASLPSDGLDSVVSPFIGQPLTRETLQKVANALSAAYSKSDIAFYSVTIPPQIPAGGELRVKIIEGHVASYTLKGKTSSTPERYIGAQVKRLMRDAPTRKSTLERTMSLLRDIPGQTIEAGLKPTGEPGELALDLNGKRKQVEVTLNVNNRGVTNVTSGVQAQISVDINGLLREADQTRVSAYVPFQPSRYQFYSLSHSTPIGTNGTRISASGAYVRTRTKINDIKGEARQIGIGLTHPLIRSYKRNLTLSLSLDGTNSDNYYLDTAFGGFRSRAVRAGVTWSDVGKTGGYAVSAIFSQGLDALGAREITGFSEKGFRKANLQITAVKELKKGLAFKLSTRAQYSDDMLPTTERFALGGDGAGLAFRYGTITAESALAGGAELSYRVFGTNTQGITVFAYADGALAHAVARPFYGLKARNFSLASAGVGIRAAPVKGWTASVQVALPVKKPLNSYSDKARFFFSISRSV